MVAKAVQGIVLAGLLTAGSVFAGDTAAKYVPVISGYASLEAGEIMKGFSSQSGEIRHAWLETGYMGFCADAAVSKYLRIIAGGEAQLYFSFNRTAGIGANEYVELRQSNVAFAIKHGEALYTIGSSDLPAPIKSLQIEVGFFPYKYDSDVRNLGEYLFRSYAYPASLVNQFDKPYADLAGFRIGGSIALDPVILHDDLLLTTSTNFWPFMDWSLTDIADASIPGLVTIGAGVQLWDLFSVGVDNSTAGTGIDPTSPDSNYSGMNGVPYTFAGTKVMARLSFDPKGLLPRSSAVMSIFGKEDLKFYGEAAILGLKNYHDTSGHGGFYDSLSWRVPVTFGFNIPTVSPLLKDALGFSFLDLLNVEFEYQNSPYPNSIYQVYYNNLPLPNGVGLHAKWKWSLYAKKDIGSHISIIGQVARDHLIPLTRVNVNNFADETDVLLRNSDWWWTGKIRFDF